MIKVIKIWISAIVATSAALTAVHAAETTFALVGESTKVCQLNGETDWESGKPTAAQTQTNFGMYAADLGTPVDTGGSTLYFLFGDTWPSPALGVKRPNDAVGTSTLKTTPAKKTCLDLQIATVPSSSPPIFAPATVTPKIDQGYFNVPSGGVYANPSLYAFFWTDHCEFPTKLDPSPSDPLKLPASTSGCSESASLNSVGISVLGQSVASDVVFTTPIVGGTDVIMPSGFVYVNAVDATHKPNLAPSSQQLGVFITGVPRYRASVPYLAYSTPANLDDPSNWMFFNGLSGGTPNWISYTTWQSFTTWRDAGCRHPLLLRSTIPLRPRSASASTRSAGTHRSMPGFSFIIARAPRSRRGMRRPRGGLGRPQSFSSVQRAIRGSTAR